MADDRMMRAATWIVDAERVSVLSGAGLSTGSGISDYRGPQGVWTKDPGAERKATIQVWMSEPDVRREAWRRRAASHIYRAQPNEGHVALAELERAGKLDTIVTQNIDGLHQAAGTSPERVVEIHGTMHQTVCLDCGARAPIEVTLDRVRSGDEDPHCELCSGLLKSATISFGQALVAEDIERAVVAAERSDVFLAVGTSLTVYPAAQVPLLARDAGAKLMIVNAEPTALDDEADAVLQGDTTDVLPALISQATS